MKKGIFIIYNDPGATATDFLGSGLSSDIIIDNNVDINTISSYYITYNL